MFNGDTQEIQDVRKAAICKTSATFIKAIAQNITVCQLALSHSQPLINREYICEQVPSLLLKSTGCGTE
ncbi:MAG: hypothetical protein ABRQ26_06085 [Syntrophomonadaceae bacterium]